MKRVLFVCYGNMLRSPIAERFFRKAINRLGLVDELSVSSCGIQGAHGKNPTKGKTIWDYPISETLRKILLEFEINMDDHLARPLTDEIVLESDIIILVAPEHANLLRSEFLSCWQKVFLLGWQNLEGVFSELTIIDLGDKFAAEEKVRRELCLLRNIAEICVVLVLGH